MMGWTATKGSEWECRAEMNRLSFRPMQASQKQVWRLVRVQLGMCRNFV